MAIDLDELEKLAAQATSGPWFVTCNCTGKTFYTIKNDRVYIGEALGVYNGEANAAYIAAACNAAPELIARVRELEAELEALDTELFGEAATNYQRAAEIEEEKAKIEEMEKTIVRFFSEILNTEFPENITIYVETSVQYTNTIELFSLSQSDTTFGLSSYARSIRSTQ